MSREPEELEDDGWGETSRYAAHLDRGWSLLDRGDLGAARTSAEQAQELRPEAPDAAVLLGAIALAERDPDESLRWYDRALELDPEYLEPHAAAAQLCLFDLGDAARALRYCEEALELEHLAPFDALDMHLLAAECELGLGQHKAISSRLDTLDEVDALVAALDKDATKDLSESEADAHTAAATFLYYDADGEALDETEQTEQLQRVLQFALRLSRLWLDVGSAAQAVELLQQVVKRFPHDGDAWHLLSEAEHATGDARAACQAALRTHQLDAQMRPPKWTPSPALLHRKVVQTLRECLDPLVRKLVDGTGVLVVLIQDAPAQELVMEGVDPRVPALALASRAQPSGPKPPDATDVELTGLAIYRRNILRLARTPEQFDEELRHGVLEELAAFLQLDDDRRVALGLQPLRTTALSDERDDEDTDPPTRRRRKMN